MDTDSLFEVPLYFFREYINGWFFLIIIIVIIYFVILRDYYIKRENFYDQSKSMENIEEIENTEEQNMDYEDEDEDEDEDENGEGEDNINEEPKHKKNMNINMNMNMKMNMNKKSSVIGENHTEIKGKHVFEGLGDIEGFEGFVTPMSTSYASTTQPSTTEPSTTQPSTTQPSTTQPSTTQLALTINTTLFDNLKITDTQINLCKTFYSTVIKTYITDLTKLLKLKKNNEYLNTKKEFDIIIGRGIDNIINYLSNTIKTPNILTRTSIKTDVLNSLSNNIELLINNTNNDLTSQMNSLAVMNSTTIDYKSMMKTIDDSRTQLDIYIDIAKLIVNNGTNLNRYNSKVNNILNQSFVLPIYERNFDKITQLVKSDFNDNETNMANKYGQAYTDFINEKKKDELDINPLRLASKVESGIVDMITSLVGRNSNSNSNGNSNSNSNSNKLKIIESSTNPIPEQQYNRVNTNNTNNNLNINANIYKDKGNLGNYLIDKKTQKQVLESFKTNEGFEGEDTPKPSIDYNIKKNKTKNNKDILSNLMSGEFLQYIMDIINDKLGLLFGIYNKKFGSSNGSNDKDMKFNLEENMIPAGFLLFILSMLIYFIDTTS